MNIEAIEDAIETLKNGDTTVKTVQELAGLYIVREYLKERDLGAVEGELQDILPQYRRYCTVKREYQLNRVPETAVIQSMQLLCKEIQEFIQTLYSYTDTNRERKQIRELLDFLHQEYVENR